MFFLRAPPRHLCCGTLISIDALTQAQTPSQKHLTDNRSSMVQAPSMPTICLFSRSFKFQDALFVARLTIQNFLQNQGCSSFGPFVRSEVPLPSRILSFRTVCPPRRSFTVEDALLAARFPLQKFFTVQDALHGDHLSLQKFFRGLRCLRCGSLASPEVPSRPPAFQRSKLFRSVHNFERRADCGAHKQLSKNCPLK